MDTLSCIENFEVETLEDFALEFLPLQNDLEILALNHSEKDP